MSEIIGNFMGIPIKLNSQLPDDGWFLLGLAKQCISHDGRPRWVAMASLVDVVKAFDAMTGEDVSDEFLSED